MASRRPVPPAELAANLSVADAGPNLHSTLAVEGRARLAHAEARPGRVRESAFRLLEADALITYACEAAFETEHPTAALKAILSATKD